MAEGIDIITKSGRLQTIRVSKEAREPIPVNPESFLKNLKLAWDRCNEMKKRDGTDDKLIGYIFFKELRKLFDRSV